ncbi:MAG: c-type cytochrome [Chloroflexi bacterium]|nr:c-type cytochrome [Chloroflexota bacterium]
MKKLLVLSGVLLVLVAVLAACGGNATEAPVVEQPTEAPVVTEAPTEAPVSLSGDPIHGGLLYDNWIKVLGVDTPEGNQPLWATQTTNTRSGKDTWRCKECHGWDYKGVDGAYGGGSHQTGFVGVFQVAGTDANEILAALKGSTNPDHDFSAVMDEQALTDLALFLSEYQFEGSAFINADKTITGGDLESGKAVFGENCTDCHGPQGTAINWKNDATPNYVGFLVLDNPLETLHKVRFGQPGVADMPSLVDVGVSDAEYNDLLAYLQTLPVSSPVTEGGRLYDNWIKAIGAADMTENQPLWATQTTNTRTGNDTWRCKECHGWDFKGVDGRYAEGSHATGFPGVLAAKDKPAEELLAAMKTGDHDFSAYLNDAQLNALVAFVQQTQDFSPYINDNKTVNGNAENGKVLYESNCQACHAEDGKALDFDDGEGVEFVGTVAADNPWEVLNKIANGQPAAAMTAGLNMEWTWQDFVDILAYIQTLPIE